MCFVSFMTLVLEICKKRSFLKKKRFFAAEEYNEDVSFRGNSWSAVYEVCLRCEVVAGGLTEAETHTHTPEVSTVCFVCCDCGSKAGASREEMSCTSGEFPAT